MLRENQQARPNIYQTLKEACAMQGREVPIKDVRTLFFGKRNSS
jgi:AP2-associated kinase